MNINHCTRIITHANCADGIASAMILRRALDLPVTWMSHGDDPDPEPALFCDISPPRHRVQEWFDAGACVLDHHATARDIVERFGVRGWYGDQSGVSGARLAYKLTLCINNSHAHFQASLFAATVGAYDTWSKQHALGGWGRACAAAEALLTYGGDEMLRSGRAWLTDDEYRVGRCVYERKLSQCQASLDAAQRISINDLRLLVAPDSRGLTNYMADMAREQGRRADALLTWRVGGGRARWSIRAIGDVDVSAFAQARGGGGHPGAAGFSTAAPDAVAMLTSEQPLSDDELVAWLSARPVYRNDAPSLVHAIRAGDHRAAKARGELRPSEPPP